MFDYFDVYKTENLLCSALTGPDPESGYFLPEPLWPWKEIVGKKYEFLKFLQPPSP